MAASFIQSYGKTVFVTGKAKRGRQKKHSTSKTHKKPQGKQEAEYDFMLIKRTYQGAGQCEFILYF